MDQDPSYPPPPPYLPPPEAAPSPRLPWEERQRLGFGEALVATVRLLITAPQDAFRRLRPDDDLTSPILFGVILTWVGQFVYLFWQMLWGSALDSLGPLLGNWQGAAALSGGGLGVVQAVIMLVLAPIFYVIFLFIFSGIYHLALSLLGGLDRSPLGFAGTLKVLAYASVAGLGNVVPFVGVLIVLIGSVILLVIGFSEAHRTDQGKAIIAVLIPLVLCCVCVAVLAVLFGAAIAAAIAAAASHG